MNAPTLKKIFQFLFYIFAIAVLIATGMRTYQLLLKTTENVVTAIFGLVMFEIGMLIWLAVAIFVSQGVGQRSVSFIASAFNLLLVVAATGLDVMLESTINSAQINREQLGWYVLWTVIAATTINVLMLWLAHVLDPHAAAELRRRGVQDAIDEQVSKEVEAKTPDIAKQAAAKISDSEIARAVAEFTNNIAQKTENTPTLSESSAGGSAPNTFTREEVDAMIANALSRAQRAPLVSKNGRHAASVFANDSEHEPPKSRAPRV